MNDMTPPSSHPLPLPRRKPASGRSGTAHETAAAPPPAQGRVWLVGAGPGDPELLTLKALRVLRQCDVWLVDDLVGPGILELAAPGTRILRVGKRGGCTSTPQAFILRLMARHARQGRMVARVKGGDPFIFGRGGEESAWLAERGIRVDSVSGVTAGLAAGSALGIPLTHREVSRGVIFVTARTADDSHPAWEALARSGLTVVCYMGMGKAAPLVQALLQAGFAPDLPVAVAERVSCSDQRALVTRLRDLPRDIALRGLRSPAVIILGEAVAHRCAVEDRIDAITLIEYSMPGPCAGAPGASFHETLSLVHERP